MLPCPVHKLPPTYQLLAMVRDGFSGLWIMLGLRTVLSDHHLRCLWQFWLHTYPVQLPKWDQGCNGKQCSPCATLAPVCRGESFTEVLQDTVISEVPISTFLLGSLVLISSERCVSK